MEPGTKQLFAGSQNRSACKSKKTYYNNTSSCICLVNSNPFIHCLCTWFSTQAHPKNTEEKFDEIKQLTVAYLLKWKTKTIRNVALGECYCQTARNAAFLSAYSDWHQVFPTPVLQEKGREQDQRSPYMNLRQFANLNE